MATASKRESHHFLLLAIAWVSALFFLILLQTRSYFPYSYEVDIIKLQGPAVFWHLANFDGAHYQNIAQFGYIAKFQTAFFPLFPLTLKLLSTLIGGNSLITAVILSVSLMFGSVLILTKLFKSKTAAYFLIFSPVSFFLITSYTESLFIFFSLLFWYLWRTKKIFPASIIGILLTATRFYGILLLPVAVIDYLQRLPAAQRTKVHHYFPLLPLLASVVGLLAYMIFLKSQYHDPLSFFHSLSLWHKSSLVLFPQTLYRYLKIFITARLDGVYLVAVLEFLSFWLGLGVALFYYLKKQYSFSLYLVLGTLIPASTGTLQSLPRYLLGIFPILFLFDYLRLKPILVKILLALSLIMQFILFHSFINGFFIS